MPIVRTFISFPAGVARMPLSKFVLYSTLGAFPWSILLVFAGEQLGSRWQDIRHALQPFDLAIAVDRRRGRRAVHLVADGSTGTPSGVLTAGSAGSAGRRGARRGARRRARSGGQPRPRLTPRHLRGLADVSDVVQEQQLRFVRPGTLRPLQRGQVHLALDQADPKLPDRNGEGNAEQDPISACCGPPRAPGAP